MKILEGSAEEIVRKKYSTQDMQSFSFNNHTSALRPEFIPAQAIVNDPRFKRKLAINQESPTKNILLDSPLLKNAALNFDPSFTDTSPSNMEMMRTISLRSKRNPAYFSSFAGSNLQILKIDDFQATLTSTAGDYKAQRVQEIQRYATNGQAPIMYHHSGLRISKGYQLSKDKGCQEERTLCIPDDGEDGNFNQFSNTRDSQVKLPMQAVRRIQGVKPFNPIALIKATQSPVVKMSVASTIRRRPHQVQSSLTQQSQGQQLSLPQGQACKVLRNLKQFTLSEGLTRVGATHHHPSLLLKQIDEYISKVDNSLAR
ncbi:hypothetical protein FGO68_gene8594 [Halteria grandinella]|uniref:Uncharacterized protein n=1 Tax=Halteria grandinella TaxID=5974 RepID=A0A8J8T7S1_HALGN|nr:hypothetical protein FGO68_gene8594 [Halteria grandinella]